MAVQKFKTPAASSITRFKTMPPKGGGGTGPCPPGSLDFVQTDSFDMSDALAGTLGPFNAPDTLDISDFFNAQDLRLGDSIALLDGMGDISGLVADDSITLSDTRNAGTSSATTLDSLDISDALVLNDLSASDTLALGDARTQDTTIAQTSDSLALGDARTAGTISTEQADSLAFADILRGIELVSAESIDVSDAMQSADLSAGNVWAGTVVLATNWDSSALAVDLDQATFALSTVAASGIGGTTNVNEAGDLTLSFPDITASLSPFTWTSVVLHYRWQTLSAGTQIAAGTVAYTVRYSLNDGGAYTTIESITAPVSDPGVKTLDLSGIADTLTEIQQFRFRMDGTIGSGTGLSKTQTIRCFFARLVLVGSRTF